MQQVKAVDLGDDLEYLINFPTGHFLSLSGVAGYGRSMIARDPLHTFTIFYLKGRNFKVVPYVDLRPIRPPHGLVIPDYDDVVGDRVSEFAFVSPITTLDDSEYAVLTNDPRYDPKETYKEDDLRYMGSPLRTLLDISDARRHNVLNAAFDWDRGALGDFLENMQREGGRDLRVKVNISRTKTPAFTTCSLYRYDSKDKPYDRLVVKAKDLGRRYLHKIGK